LENLKENGFFFLLEAVESKYGAKAVPFNEDMFANMHMHRASKCVPAVLVFNA
jgi:hypothetical protein